MLPQPTMPTRVGAVTRCSACAATRRAIWRKNRAPAPAWRRPRPSRPYFEFRRTVPPRPAPARARAARTRAASGAPEARLAAGAALRRRVQAGIDSLDVTAGGSDSVQHPRVDPAQPVGGQQSTADHPLVGNDDHSGVHGSQCRQRLEDARKKLELLPALDVIGTAAIDHPVAVQKDGRHRGVRQAAPSGSRR